MKLSDYSKQEQRAVFKQMFKDTPSIRFGDLTPTQKLNMMKTFNAQMLVLRIRIRKFWEEVKAAAERNRNGN